MDINLQYDEFIKNLIRYWNKSKAVDITQVDKLMDGLSSVYLAATVEQRDTMRKLFGLMDTLFYLQEYARRTSAKIVDPRDADLLLLGLAAISIEDGRADYRDTLICLGDLWLSTEKAGTDPKPYFDKVAEISNTEIRNGGSSTKNLMRDFQNTGHYKKLKGERLTEEEVEYYEQLCSKEDVKEDEIKPWWKFW